MAHENMLNEELYDEFEYSDNSESDTDVEIENQYRRGKNAKVEDLNIALRTFEKVLEFEGNCRTKWGFKALKQMMEINLQLKMYEGVLSNYEKMLNYYLDSVVTKSQYEESVYSILNLMVPSRNFKLLQTFYEVTLEALNQSGQDRLWFNINMKMARIFWYAKQYLKMSNILKTLMNSCKNDLGQAIPEKHAQLLEINVFKLEIYTEQTNITKMKKVYGCVLKLSNIKPRPSILCTIKECGGKLYSLSGQYERAYSHFLAAFQIHDDSGNPKRITFLKYLMLCSMLMNVPIDPMSSRESQRCANHPEIIPMKELINAYNTNKAQFEAILNERQSQQLEDPFVRDQVEKLLDMIRTQALITILFPHTRMTLTGVAYLMSMTKDEAEALLTTSIKNGIVEARVDQVDGIVTSYYMCTVRQIGRREQSKKLADSLFTTIKNIMNELKKINSVKDSP